VSRFGRRTRLSVLLRSFAIQGSWNYRTLLGTGFAFALMPVLRSLYGSDPNRLRDAVERHRALFNTHPYLAPMALGAVATLEEEGEDPAILERFKMAVRGSLGSLGDRLVWAGWRPVCLLFGLTLIFAGAPWWLGVISFLALYNAGHLLLRVWSYRLGCRESRRVGEALRHSPVMQAQRALGTIGAFLAGLALPLAATGAAVGAALSPPWIAAAIIAAALGARFGAAIRRPLVGSLAAFTFIGLIWHVFL
jgi:mannose/fructose/N-acetylgalactosamine-specific phosphotransferase system component IID